MSINSKKKIAIFASGTGSNFKNIYNNICNGYINASIEILISNNLNCKSINFAKKNNIHYKIINNFRFSENDIEGVMLKTLKEHEIDLIVLAGYMKKIPNQIISVFEKKILNIHPSLLPKFGGKGYYGMKVHEAVIKSNEKKTGVTIHFVDSGYDTGKIIFQESIDVLSHDTPNSLCKKVLAIEHKIYPKIIKEICQ